MTIHFENMLTARDLKQHIAHEFDVPAGTTELAIRFQFAPRSIQHINNLLTLTLFDPNGFRGAGHRGGALHEVMISAAHATPGYLPGAPQPGSWRLFIDTHVIMPDEPIHYEIDITLSSEPVVSVDITPTPGRTPARGANWYRGDLHGHTFHSDGHWSVEDFVQYAREYRLDFVTLTDHNTISHFAEIATYSSTELLAMHGMELTTFYGHALALGVPSWIDWRVQPGGLTMPLIANEVNEMGGLFVIAHPMSDGDPKCSGCDWQYPDMKPGNARFVEIWNSIWEGDSNNNQAVTLWYQWLNQGYRIICTAGTDIHGPMMDPEPGFNMIYAYELSQAGILDAIRRGHLYLSSGPRLELEAFNTHHASAVMGALLPGKPAEVTAHWTACNPGYQLHFIIDGKVVETMPLDEHGQHTWSVFDQHAHWCVIEIRTLEGRMRAITNPVFFDRSPDKWL